jgi:argininosuccinate lyase
MQEDKEPLFDALESSKLTLKVMSGMILDMAINHDKMLAMASSDYSCATDLADWLVKNLKIPFRQSHHITGSIVKMAEDRGLQLHELKLVDLQKIEKKITKDVFNFLDAKSSIESRTSFGGTSPVMVQKQLDEAHKYLKNR